MQQGEMKFRDGKIVRRDKFRWFTGVKSKTPGGEHISICQALRIASLV
jgi:hypothetical protein